LGDVVGAFKSITTHRYIQGVRELGWSPFEKRFWQRDYWERVIRDDRELEETRSYILENPARRFETRGVA
jgi:putative transposase